MRGRGGLKFSIFPVDDPSKSCEQSWRMGEIFIMISTTLNCLRSSQGVIRMAGTSLITGIKLWNPKGKEWRPPLLSGRS